MQRNFKEHRHWRSESKQGSSEGQLRKRRIKKKKKKICCKLFSKPYPNQKVHYQFELKPPNSKKTDNGYPSEKKALSKASFGKEK